MRAGLDVLAERHVRECRDHRDELAHGGAVALDAAVALLEGDRRRERQRQAAREAAAEISADDVDALLLDRTAELGRALDRTSDRLAAARQVGNQEAELVAAEARVQIASLGAALHRQEVRGSNLIREDARDAFDDPVADGVAERVVVPLEAVDVDDADAAPAHALLDGEERLHALHEPVEVEQLRLRVTVRFLGQIGDHVLEIAGDVADGDVLFAELTAERLELCRETLRQRAIKYEVVDFFYREGMPGVPSRFPSRM